jgi:hypothetical protein
MRLRLDLFGRPAFDLYVGLDPVEKCEPQADPGAFTVLADAQPVGFAPIED